MRLLSLSGKNSLVSLSGKNSLISLSGKNSLVSLSGKNSLVSLPGKNLAQGALMTMVVGAFAHSGSAQQVARPFRAADFERVDFAPCTENPSWADARIRASLVVHSDGVWALALDGSVNDPNYAPLVPALRQCMEDALTQRLGRVLSPAPRAARIYVRTLDLRTPLLDLPSRLTELRTRLEANRADMARCVADLAEQSLRVRIHVHADGRVEVVLPRRDTNRALCITNSIGVFAPGAEVTMNETIDGHLATVVVAEGGLCAWGGHRGPPPIIESLVCADGLMCCASGGAAGSDFVCMRVSNGCPLYP